MNQRLSKSDYNDQTDNKYIIEKIHMSIGLEEDKKQKPKTTDPKDDKPLSANEKAAKTTVSSSLPQSSLVPQIQSELFDPSRDNAMSEIREVADMSSDETAKIIRNVEGKHGLDPLTTTVSDSVKNAGAENSPNTAPVASSLHTMGNSTSQREFDEIESLEVDTVSKNQRANISPEANELAREDRLDESNRLYGNENKELYSNSLYDDNNNPFIIGLMLWQAYGIAWINAYNEFLKTWADNIKIDSSEFSTKRTVALSLSKEMQNILGHVAEMSEGAPANGVYDTAIVTQSGLSREEVYNCLVQLERLNLIKFNMKESGETFRIINITQKGVENSSWSETLDMR